MYHCLLLTVTLLLIGVAISRFRAEVSVQSFESEAEPTQITIWFSALSISMVYYTILIILSTPTRKWHGKYVDSMVWNLTSSQRTYHDVNYVFKMD